MDVSDYPSVHTTLIHTCYPQGKMYTYVHITCTYVYMYTLEMFVDSQLCMYINPLYVYTYSIYQLS